ncbi:hypothetical protein [Parasitella parasitica]|uniref:Uncharacterized protein n=1 Tax=Parasitella parasitica TaxID=35722 RepID=A0A0B7NSM9_9FUNG|nr:hypothetical protein [Parasitella parasitica]
MPVMSTNLDINVRASVSTHFLMSTRAMEILGRRFDFNAPHLRFSGITTGNNVDQHNKVLFEVVLDELPDDTLTLYGTSLKYGGPKIRKERGVNVSNIVMERNDTNDGEDNDNLEDAEASEEEEEVVVESDDVWNARDVYTDSRSDDTNNNKRDNMVSFHDIMKICSWENRFLVFTFGIAEINVFSCFEIWGIIDGKVNNFWRQQEPESAKLLLLVSTLAFPMMQNALDRHANSVLSGV